MPSRLPTEAGGISPASASAGLAGRFAARSLASVAANWSSVRPVTTDPRRAWS
jgi:hypothetical protein